MKNEKLTSCFASRANKSSWTIAGESDGASACTNASVLTRVISTRSSTTATGNCCKIKQNKEKKINIHTYLIATVPMILYALPQVCYS